MSGYGGPPTSQGGYGGYGNAPPPYNQQNAYSQNQSYSNPPSYNPQYNQYQSQTPYGGQAPPPPQQQQYPGVDPESQSWFAAVDTSGKGRITADQLRECLINPSGGQPFDEATCSMLVKMFDGNGDGTIDVREFAALRNFVAQWKVQFDRFDTSRSGNLTRPEVEMALKGLDYHL